MEQVDPSCPSASLKPPGTGISSGSLMDTFRLWIDVIRSLILSLISCVVQRSDKVSGFCESSGSETGLHLHPAVRAALPPAVWVCPITGNHLANANTHLSMADRTTVTFSCVSLGLTGWEVEC